MKKFSFTVTLQIVMLLAIVGVMVTAHLADATAAVACAGVALLAAVVGSIVEFA